LLELRNPAFTLQIFTMTDVKMNGGVALEVGSPTELSNKINSGAMDVVSVADSTTNRL